MLEHLKRYAPCSIRDFTSALGVSENTVRYHLERFKTEGLVQSARTRNGVGRPAKVYTLTRKAEGMFPKRYQELLELVLAEAAAQRALEPLLEGVAQNLAQEAERGAWSNAGRNAFARPCRAARLWRYARHTPHSRRYLDVKGLQLLFLRRGVQVRGGMRPYAPHGVLGSGPTNAPFVSVTVRESVSS